MADGDGRGQRPDAAAGAARAEWWSDSYAQSADALEDFVTALASTSSASWAQYQLELAETRRDWWDGVEQEPGQRGLYLQWIADVNARYTAYESSVDAAYLTEQTALASADVTYATSLGTAAVTYAGNLAEAQRVYVAGSGGQSGMAVARETYLVAQAQADRDYAVDKTVADYSAAIASTKKAYAVALAVATSACDIASARAVLTCIASTSGISGANVTWTNTTASATKTYAQTEASAYAARQRAIEGWDTVTETGGLNAAYRQQEVESYQAAVDALFRSICRTFLPRIRTCSGTGPSSSPPRQPPTALC